MLQENNTRDSGTSSGAGSGTATGWPARGVTFHLSDLCYCRTDPSGILQSGNTAFQRINEFTWSELIGASHMILRHPEMPKAVFHLIMQSLEQGEPIGAYVMNRAKSGRLHWVFSVIMPISGGFMSVQLKPNSALLAEVAALYRDLHAAEQDPAQALSPEDSAARLTARLTEMGLPNYRAFMAKGLTTELLSIDQTLNRGVDDRLESFDEMAGAVREIVFEANRLYADFRKIEQIPVNLRLQASRCEAAGGPVSVISDNYSNLAREALTFAARFTGFGQEVLDEINSGLFLMGATRLQREMCLSLACDDSPEAPVDFAREAAQMKRHQKRSGEMTRAAVTHILDTAKRFIADSRRMRRFVGGLDVIRVTCRIETGWLPDRDGGFRDIISKLDRFHEDVERRMKRIDALNDIIIEGASTLLNRRKSARYWRRITPPPPPRNMTQIAPAPIGRG